MILNGHLCWFFSLPFLNTFRYVPVFLLSLTVSFTSDMPKPSTSILVMQRYTSFPHLSPPRKLLNRLWCRCFISILTSSCRQTMEFVSWGMMTQILRKRRKNTSLPSRTWWSGLVSLILHFYTLVWLSHSCKWFLTSVSVFYRLQTLCCHARVWQLSAALRPCCGSYSQVSVGAMCMCW